jgi:hypothetical protein
LIRLTLAVTAALMLGLTLGTAAYAQDSVAVPSGQLVVLSEVLIDDSPGETWLRFRFLAPQIAREGGDIDTDTAASDMDHLCEHLVLPYLAQYTLDPSRVVISLSDRDVPFGASAPEATQFFEQYRPENTTCIWEGF